MHPQDPLAELRDIITPDAVGWWPLAPGWWLLLFLTLALILLAVVIARRIHARGAYRREAHQLLKRQWQDYQQHRDATQLLSQLLQVLRRTAVTAYGNNDIATLQGESWLQFLDSTAGKPGLFLTPLGRQLLTLPYQSQPQGDLLALHRLVLRWIDHHRRKIPGGAVGQNASEAHHAAV